MSESEDEPDNESEVVLKEDVKEEEPEESEESLSEEVSEVDDSAPDEPGVAGRTKV